MRLYDAVMSAITRLEHRAQIGECPTANQDVLIGDYRRELLAVADDLRTFDPEVRKVADARRDDKLDGTPQEGKEALADAAEALAPVSTSDLAAEFREDVEVLRDPHAQPSETRQAIYRVSSRALRIVQLVYKSSREVLSESADVFEDVAKLVKNAVAVTTAYAYILWLFA